MISLRAPGGPQRGNPPTPPTPARGRARPGGGAPAGPPAGRAPAIKRRDQPLLSEAADPDQIQVFFFSSASSAAIFWQMQKTLMLCSSWSIGGKLGAMRTFRSSGSIP